MLCKGNTVPYKSFWHGLPLNNLCWSSLWLSCGWMIPRRIFSITFSGPKTKLFGLHFPGMEIAVMCFFLNIRRLPQYHWPFKDYDREGPHSQNLMTFRCILSGPVNLHLSNWFLYSSPHLWKQLPNRALSALMGFNYFVHSHMGPSPTHQSP